MPPALSTGSLEDQCSLFQSPDSTNADGVPEILVDRELDDSSPSGEVVQMCREPTLYRELCDLIEECKSVITTSMNSNGCA